MTDLSNRRAAIAVDLAIQNKSAADTGPDSHVEQILAAATRAEPSLGERGDIAVVAHDRRKLQRLLAPAHQGKVVPAFDLMALGDDARRAIHRSAKADADSLQLTLLQQRSADRFDVVENARRATPGIDIAPFDGYQVWATAITDAQLQLGAADFNAQVHAALSVSAKREITGRV